jgi:hypothetical protein
MKKYHYIDDQGNVIDPLPLAALQKIGLPPATKVLIEGGKQWITLAEATAGDSTVTPPPPAPAPPSLTPPTSTTIAATSHSEQNFWKILIYAVLFGSLGAHRFLVGKWKTGILQLINFFICWFFRGEIIGWTSVPLHSHPFGWTSVPDYRAANLMMWLFSWPLVDVVTILFGKFSDGKQLAIPNPNPKTTWAGFGVVVLLAAMTSSKPSEPTKSSESTKSSNTSSTSHKSPEQVLRDHLNGSGMFARHRVAIYANGSIGDTYFFWVDDEDGPGIPRYEAAVRGQSVISFKLQR